MKAVYCFCASFLLISLWHQTSACTQKARSSSLESKVWDGFPNDLTFPPVQPTLPLRALLFLASVYPYLQRSLWLWSPALGSFRKMKSLKILALSRCKLYYAVVCIGGIYRNLIIHMNDFSPCKNPGISTIYLGSVLLILMHQSRIWSQNSWRVEVLSLQSVGDFLELHIPRIYLCTHKSRDGFAKLPGR